MYKIPQASKYIQILNPFEQVCTLEEFPASEIIIARCKRGEHWATFNPKFEIYSFLNEANMKQSVPLV